MRDLFLPEAAGASAFAFVGSPLPIVLFLALLNVVTFFVYGDDKRRAKHPGARRIPEKTLLLMAALGAALARSRGCAFFTTKRAIGTFGTAFPRCFFCSLRCSAAHGGAGENNFAKTTLFAEQNGSERRLN